MGEMRMEMAVFAYSTRDRERSSVLELGTKRAIAWEEVCGCRGCIESKVL